MLLVFIPLTGDYITALVLGGAKGNMAGVMVASQFTVAQNWALGAAQAVILIVDDLGDRHRVRADRARLPIDRTSEPEDHAACGGRGGGVSSAALIGRGASATSSSLALRIWGIAVYAFLFLPILVIVVYSFNNGRSHARRGAAFGLDGYRTGTTDPTILDAVKTSIVAATGTAIIATILGIVRGDRPGAGARANGRCSSSPSSS